MKVRRYAVMIGFAAELVLAACTSSVGPLNPPTTAIISGIAKDENGVGVPGVLMRISNSSIIQDISSDSAGIILLEDVTVGTYDMNFYPPANYILAPGQASSTPINLVDGQVLRPAVQLKKSPGTPSGITVGHIKMLNFFFQPTVIHVARGGTVTFQNLESDLHTANSDLGSEINSGTLVRYGRYSHTFNTPGDYSFRCLYHEQMTGKIIVDP